MKISFLIVGIALFFLGVFVKTKVFIAVGIIFVITSFFGKKLKIEKEELTKQKTKIKTKSQCSHCGTEVLHEDNYCPECGNKILP